MSTVQVALHPEALRLLAEHEAAGQSPIYERDVVEARRALVAAARNLPREPVAIVRDDVASGPGGAIPIRVYRPEAERRPLPLVLYVHGGCWVLGDLDSHDADCRSIANRAGCVVVSVDYRLAPEHRFPAALDDTYAVLNEVVERGSEFDADVSRLGLCGVSAGGNLAAAACLRTRDDGGPRLAAAVLVYPVLDASLSTRSYQSYEEGFLLTRRTMAWSWEQYLASPDDARDQYAAPLLAEDVSDLPPTLVITAEHDPLRDEGEAFATRLAQAGVTVDVARFDGMVHTFFSSPGVLEVARQAHDAAAAHFRRWLFTDVP
jgi:acetyl esterase